MDQQTILQRLYCHGNKLDSHCVIPEAIPGFDFDYVQEEPAVILLAELPPDLSPACAELIHKRNAIEGTNSVYRRRYHIDTRG